MFQEILQGGGGGSSEPITWETFNQSNPILNYTITNKKGYKMYLFAYNTWVNIGVGNYGKITSISGGTILENTLRNNNNTYFDGYAYVIDITEDTCTISFKNQSYMDAIFFK